jgi:sugar phosphate isomerase/epimerase
MITDVGLDNQGVGLDTANGIMYGTGHPADALEVYGQHVRSVNAKDGLWPTNPRQFGAEVAIGKGKVDFPRVLRRLRELNYTGPITIERETQGPEQIEDIRRSKIFLEQLLAQ